MKFIYYYGYWHISGVFDLVVKDITLVDNVPYEDTTLYGNVETIFKFTAEILPAALGSPVNLKYQMYLSLDGTLTHPHTREITTGPQTANISATTTFSCKILYDENSFFFSFSNHRSE